MSNEGFKSMIVNAQFDPNLATKKLARIRESMFSTKVEEQKAFVHIHRFDGTLANFAYNEKLNKNHHLTLNYLTHTIQESPLDYKSIYKFTSGKKKIFTFADMISNPDIFSYVAFFFLDSQLYVGEIPNQVASSVNKMIPGVLFLFTELM